jgi:TolA-binding protein
MMKPYLPVPVVAFVLVSGLFQGCWWKEIERENISLRAQLDSINKLYNGCVVENSRTTVRIQDLERQNVKLEERNVQLANRMIEIGKLPPPPRVEPSDTPPPAEGATFVQRQSNAQIPLKTVVRDTAAAPGLVNTAPADTRMSRDQEQVASDTEEKEPAKEQIEAEPAARKPEAAKPITIDRQAATMRAGDRFLERYQAALAEFNLRHFSTALEGFTSILSSFESNDMSDNCEYWIGECHYALGKYEAAIESFTNVLRYTQSDKTDDALMMRGNTWLRLKHPDKAKLDYQRIVDEFPDSEFALRAKQKLRSGK